MRWLSLPLQACLFAALALGPLDSRAQDKKPAVPPDFAEPIRPLLKSYCFECHNANKRKGGLNLDKIESETESLDLVELWELVGERLKAKEMPPARSKKQPSDDERQKLLAWVKHVADSQVICDKL